MRSELRPEWRVRPFSRALGSTLTPLVSYWIGPPQHSLPLSRRRWVGLPRIVVDSGELFAAISESSRTGGQFVFAYRPGTSRDDPAMRPADEPDSTAALIAWARAARPAAAATLDQPVEAQCMVDDRLGYLTSLRSTAFESTVEQKRRHVARNEKVPREAVRLRLIVHAQGGLISVGVLGRDADLAAHGSVTEQGMAQLCASGHRLNPPSTISFRASSKWATTSAPRAP